MFHVICAGDLKQVAGIAMSEVQRHGRSSTSLEKGPRSGGALFLNCSGTTLVAHMHLKMLFWIGLLRRGGWGWRFAGRMKYSLFAAGAGGSAGAGVAGGCAWSGSSQCQPRCG